tara:strand:- start:239 stop:541 length:303 start_codon:yes stop_codon:yes gene_type:complete
VDNSNLADAIAQYGFPIIAAVGLGYFIWYIWSWVTKEVNPVIEESHMTLIGLIDRIRMMDNDLIRLNTKLNMILQQQDNVQIPTDEEVDEVIKRIKSEQR